MLIKLKKCINFIGLWLSITACQTVKLTDDLALVGLSTDLTPGKQIGVLTAEHCGIRVLGIGTSPDLTGTMRNFRARHPTARYLTRVRIEERNKQYVFLMYERDCWFIRGLGYE